MVNRDEMEEVEDKGREGRRGVEDRGKITTEEEMKR